VADVSGLYHAAPALAARGERVVSTDELTGVQALERKHPGLPPAPGKVERREFEYVRHGTRSFIVSRDVVTGQIVAPACGPTRTEADFLAHIAGVVATDPAAARWHFVVDNLNTHQSAALVRFVARLGPGPGGEGPARHPRQPGEPGGVPQRLSPPHRLPLHPQALVLAQSGRALAEHPCPQAAAPRLLHLGRGSPG
jgi:hypothetical protein